MPLRVIGRPAAPPKPVEKVTKPAVQPSAKPQERIRKPEPVRPGLDSPKDEGEDGGKAFYSMTIRANQGIKDHVERIMAVRDCTQSEAIKYAIRVIGNALSYPTAVLTLTDDNGDPAVLPLMRDGQTC